MSQDPALSSSVLPVVLFSRRVRVNRSLTAEETIRRPRWWFEESALAGMPGVGEGSADVEVCFLEFGYDPTYTQYSLALGALGLRNDGAALAQAMEDDPTLTHGVGSVLSLWGPNDDGSLSYALYREDGQGSAVEVDFRGQDTCWRGCLFSGAREAR